MTGQSIETPGRFEESGRERALVEPPAVPAHQASPSPLGSGDGLAPVPEVDNRLFVPGWEQAERARLDAGRCPGCEALPPNHLTGCGRIKLPDPAAKRCGCGYLPGTLGCRNTHGGAK